MDELPKGIIGWVVLEGFYYELPHYIKTANVKRVYASRDVENKTYVECVDDRDDEIGAYKGTPEEVMKKIWAAE